MSRIEDKMKEREATKLKQKQKLLATPGYNQLDNVSELAMVPNISGAIGRSRPLCIDDLGGGGRFPPCRTTLYPPSAASAPKVSNAPPSSSLIMEHVYGYRGNDARDNARWCDAETLVYHAGATAIIHNVARNRQQHYTAHDDDITSLSLCLKPRVAATGQCGRVARVQIWGIDSRATISTISNPALQRRITALSWSRSGSHLVAVGGDDNRTAFVFCFSRRTSAAQVYKENILGSSSKDANEDASRHPTLNFSSPQLIFSVALQPADVFSVQFNSFSGNDGAGEFWAVGDKMVKSCDILARSCSKGIFGGNGVLQSALSVTFSSSPAFVITGMADGDIYFWSAGSLITRNQNAHPGGVTCVAWFSQMTDKGPVSRLVSGGKDDYLRIWDMSDRVASLTATLHSTTPHPFPLLSRFSFAPALPRSLGSRACVVSLDYRQESDRLAVGMSKNSLFIIEVAAFIPAHSAPTEDITSAQRALTKDQLTIVSSGHSGEIGALAMIPWHGLQCAVTGAMDGTVRLWEMRDRKQTATAQLPAPIRCIHCSSDGKLIAFGHTSGLLSVFKTSDLMNTPVTPADANQLSKNSSKSAESDSMFWRTQPSATACLFISSADASKTAGSKTKSSASAALASELRAIPGCVYVGLHRRECITDVKFSPCGRYLVSASQDNFLDLYSVNPTGAENRPTSIQPSISTSIAASMVRSHSASEAQGGSSGGDTFWRPHSASQQQSSTRPAVTDNFGATLPPRLKSSSAVLEGAVAPATHNVVSAQHYAVKRIGVCSGHSSYVTHVDFSRDSTLMRSSDGANEVLFWGVPDCVQNPRTMSLKDIKWATCTVVYGWDVRSIWPSGSDGTDINAIDVTCDGDAMITADDNSHVKLFRYPAAGDAQMFKAYLGHSSHVLNARFSLDGHRAFTCGGVDAAVIQWRHCDRAFASSDDFNWMDPKSMPTHSFTVGVYSGPEGGSFDSIWVELIGPNMRSSRQTLCEKSAIKDALNLNTAATSLPKSACTAYAISVPSLLSHVIRLGVGIVGKPSSFCDIEKVKIQSPSGQESVFYARNCLNCHMPDTELLPGNENCVKLTVNCVTGDVMNAGTGGSVFICLFDTQGNSSGVRCLRPTDSRTSFQRKQTDTFDLFCNPPLGPAASLNVLLEPKGVGSDWYLEKFVLLRPKTGSVSDSTSLSQAATAAAAPDSQDVVYFAAHSWLNTDFPTMKLQGSSTDVVFCYTVAVSTADAMGAGTDANISVEFIGEQGSSGFRTLEQSTAGELNLFERGKTNKFVVKLGRSLGLLKMCNVSMKASGIASVGVDWLLDTIVITDETSKEDYVFPVYQWLAPDDGIVGVEMSRQINEYSVAIRTGSAFGSGTDANVWFEIIGDARTSKRRRADNSLTHLNKFERGNVDIFSVKMGPSLGELAIMKIGFDASGIGADWLLDSVIVTHVPSKKEWLFVYQKELNASNRSVELVATSDALKETYLLTVLTGDQLGAGTDSNVFVSLVGSDYSSHEVELVKSLEHMDKFERAQSDTFEILLPRHLGVIQQLEVRFSPATVALGAKWLLDCVKVSRKAKPTDTVADAVPEVLFIAKRWMSAEKNRMVLAATNIADICDYSVSVLTGDEFGAGTDGNVYLTLTGDDATSDEIPLEASLTYSDKFERGHEDKFVVSTPKPLGSNLKCNVRFKPPAIGGNTWLLASVNVTIQKFPKSYSGDVSWQFPCHRWFSKTLLSMDLVSGKGFVYVVSVFTGNKSGGGTDANVHMEMWDAGGVSSGRHNLESSKTHTNKFEKGQCDVFHVTVPKKLGALTKLLIGHDNSALAGNDWFLDRVEVSEISHAEASAASSTKQQLVPVVFPCFRWLKNPDLEATLSPGVAGGVHTYTVRVWTGDEPDCGTDANIRIELLDAGGGSSGVHKLAKSSDHLDKFERGHYDTFKLEIPGELGDLVSVKVYSDIEKDHWLLNKIVVWDNYACAASCNTPGVAVDESTWADVSKSVLKANHPHRWLFPCKSWITSSDPLVLDAAPVNATVDRKKADGVSDEPLLISYDVSVFTGDFKDAAASGPVSIKLIGTKSTSNRQLLKLTTAGTAAKFERACQDNFSVLTVKDLGAISSVWVSHEPGMSLLGSASWYLDYITVKCGQSEGVRFNCRRWLDKVSREATLQPHSSADSIYIVRVVTGEEQDAGTNANVFLEMFFDNGQLPIQKLAQSEHRDKFERGQTDTFEILVPQNLKDLKSIAISSDGSGFGSKWHLSHVEVEISGKGIRTMFPCDQWLQKARLILAPGGLRDVSKSDSAAASSVKPVVFKYTVMVETGDVVRAGTDANVMITITGSKAKLEEKKLSNSKTYLDKFERGHVDEFEFEEGLDLGDIQEVFIRHDDSALFGSNNWYLESVTVQHHVAGKSCKFVCRDWLKKTKDLKPEKLLKDPVVSSL